MVRLLDCNPRASIYSSIYRVDALKHHMMTTLLATLRTTSTAFLYGTGYRATVGEEKTYVVDKKASKIKV